MTEPFTHDDQMVREGEPYLWDEVGEEVAKIIAEKARPVVERVGEDLYAHLLHSVEDYLADNLLFNLKSQLEVGERERVRMCRELAEKEADRVFAWDRVERGDRRQESLQADLDAVCEALSPFAELASDHLHPATRSIRTELDADDIRRARAALARVAGERPK